MSILDWAKRNKLSTLLLLIIAYFLYKNFVSSPVKITTMRAPTGEFGAPEIVPPQSKGLQVPSIGRSYPIYNPAPAPQVKDRLVVEESSLSLLVKNVSQTLDAIKKEAISQDGYMVESSLSRPEDAASGQITVRLPQEKLDEALAYFRSLAVKVVSENLQGEDVTDQYVDIEARLKTLEKNKARFEEIMDQATKIDEILRVQQEIISLQTQIDNLKGQQNYLQKTAEMSKITIYLSTDELSLPYAPSQPWRPEVVFKHAVRSMLGSLQKLGSLIIWLTVYSVIWIPILLIIYWLRSRGRKTPPPTTK